MKSKSLSLEEVIDRLTDLIGGSMFFLMIAFIGYNVFSFWTTGRRYGQLEEFVLTCLVWVSYISLGEHYRKKQCIRADFLITCLPPRGQKAVDLLCDLASFIIGAFVLYFAVMLTMKSTNKLTGVLKISYFWIDLGVVLGFFSLLLNIVRKYLPGAAAKAPGEEGEVTES